VLALVAHEHGLTTATRFLDWPNGVLQSLVPCNPVGAPEKPLCEGSSLNLLAYFASWPVGATIYSIVAYIFFKRRWHVA
jgi:hypothetical protein